MRYEGPIERTEEEVLELLSRPDVTPDERIKAVLSALYYANTIEFSGDLLIKEFSEADYPERYWLKNLFQTFYGMCRTDYRVEDSITLLESYRKEQPEYAAEIDEDISALREYKDIFGNRRPTSNV
jgi:hypothetical protein